MLQHLRYLSVALAALLQNAGLYAGQADDTPTAAATPNIKSFPTGHIYSPYLADQRRVTFGLQMLAVTETNIPDTGHQRFALRMGGRLELFNWTSRSDPMHQLQANVVAGFRGHFDTTHAQDNTGWDGNYGLLFNYRTSKTFAYRFGVYHDSSHVGDEYTERTGRKRIQYTREEILAGMQANLNPAWQTYLEVGYCTNIYEKPLQEYWRVQTGIQFQQHHFASDNPLGWYAGLNLTSYEERDWNVNRALQIGYAIQAAPHTWRFALDYYKGQSTIGEFFQHDEEYAGIGFYLDI